MSFIKRKTDTLFKPSSKPATRTRLLSKRAGLVLAAAGLLSTLALFASGPKAVLAEHSANAAQPVTSVASTTFSNEQKTAIEKILRNYLLQNPEFMLEVQQALQRKSEKLERARAKLAIKANSKELFHRANASIAGNPEGDVTIVEFFDYNCGFCKRALGDIATLVDKDKKVRVVFKELPILSKGSEEAARVALAAHGQGKYWELHRALLAARGRANEKTAMKVAAKLGLDIAKLKKDMTSDFVNKEIDDTRALAQRMGINGTPHFVVGNNVIPGAPDDLLDQLKGHVSSIRKNGCDVC